MLQRDSHVFDTPKTDEKSLPVVAKISRLLRNPDVKIKTEGLQELNENVLTEPETFAQDLKIHSKSLNGGVILTLYMVNDSSDPLFAQYFFSVLQKLYQVESFIKELDEIDLSNVSEQFLINITSDKTGFENILKVVN